MCECVGFGWKKTKKRERERERERERWGIWEVREMQRVEFVGLGWERGREF